MIDYKEEIYKLKEKCYSCKKCPLGHQRPDGLDPHVFATGRVPANLMFVAEGPGKNEQIQKLPLVGRSGKFFNEHVLDKIGLTRKEVFITNSVLCRPKNNRTPLPAEIDICRSHLDSQICLVNPKLIITLGNVPLYSVCEEQGITKKRGKLKWSLKWSDGNRVPVLPLFHPSYCLRGMGKKEMAEDVSIISKMLEKINKDEDLSELL